MVYTCVILICKKTLSNFSSVFRECIAESKKLRELGKMKWSALVSFSFSKILAPFHFFRDTQWPFKNKIKSEYGFK
jgi:hypothetical protein